MLVEGDRAPHFDLPDQEGRRVTLTGLLREGPLVLYFYPADFTPVCTRQACLLRDHHAPLRSAGAQVVGISPQAPESHRRFRQRHELPFPLLADPGREAIRAYGALGLLGLLVRRVTYFILPDGIIHDRVLADFRVGRHAAFVTRVIEKLERSP